MKKNNINATLRIVFLYFLFGSLWILFSDNLLAILITDIILITKVQIYKGWFFVIVTAILLYLIIDKYIKEINSQKEYNRLLFEKSPIGLALCRMDGSFVDINEAYSNIIGRTIEETLKLSYWDITPEKYIENEKEIINSLLTKGYYGPYEKEYIHKDGHFVPVRLHGLIIEKDGEKYIWSSVEDITERKVLENNLREEGIRLNLALESSSAGAWEWNIKTNEINWSEENYKILGYQPYSIKPTYSAWLERVFPEDREKVNALIKDVVNNKKDLDIEFRILLPDGRVRWINDRGKLMVDTLGNPEKMYGIQIDITERKIAEESLRNAYDRLSKIVETTPGIVCSFKLNPDGSFCIPDGSKRIEEKYGITGARLDEDATPFFKITHPDDFKNLMEYIKQSAKNLSFFRHEWRVIHPVNGEMWIEVSSIPERQSDGGILWYGVVIDITDRKKVEEEIRKTNEELYFINKIIKMTTTFTDIKEVLNNVLDEVLNFIDLEGGSICFLSIDGAFQFIEARNLSNLVLRDQTENTIKMGYNLCGNCIRERDPLILWTKEDILKYFTKDIQIKEVISFYGFFPIIIGDRCLGGLCIFTQTNKKPTERSLKLIEHICHQIAIAIDNAIMYEKIKKHTEELEDIVEKRTMELQEKQKILADIVDLLKERTFDLERANEKLKELDRLKSMFIASMSHELRTPLNSIIGFTSILLNEWVGKLNDEQKENLSIVLRSSKHLLNLINDVIDISKIEGGTIDYHFSEFDIYDVLSEIENMFKKDALDKGLNFYVEKIHENLFTDRRRLLQCIMNLVSNAIKFTIKGNVKVLSFVKDEFIEIVVEDTGIGIKKEDIPKLFEPFVRLESPLKATVLGTGLGLYLTKKLLNEVLKGKIFVSSEEGKGSKFVIRLKKRSANNEKGSCN